MLFLKQLLILSLLCHLSASTCQIDSNKVVHAMPAHFENGEKYDGSKI